MSKQLIIRNNDIEVVVTHDDINPALMSSPVVQQLEEGYGTSIGYFKNGVAVVSWRLKPYRYAEEDYGVPGWERDCIAYGIIDEDGKVIVKFQYTDFAGLMEMQREAERIIESRPKPQILKTTKLTDENRDQYRIDGDPRDEDDALIEAMEKAAERNRPWWRKLLDIFKKS